ncbi:MAG: cytochrome b/b6 domain-containing protein [Pseudomonadota bacterium]
MPTKFHPLLVAIHWIMAFMIIMLLLAGTLFLEPLANDDPQKIEGLFGHMIFGVSVMILLIIRFVTRLRSDKPAHAATGNALLDKVGVWTHWLFYPLIFLAAGSGMAMSAMAGLPDIVFFGSGDPLPASFWEYPPRYMHAVATKALGALIVLHIAAALWHQFVKRDGLLGRMWFGRRKAS